MKDIYRDQRFWIHLKNRPKAFREDRRLRTIVGRLVWELKRNFKENHDYGNLLELIESILSQKRSGLNKIYSIHEPDLQCISKGEELQNYEFGNEVSILRSVHRHYFGGPVFSQ